MSSSAGYILTQVPAVITAYYSFKMNENWFSASFIEHDEVEGSFVNQIYKTGVCQLGKFGAWAMFVNILVTSILMIIGESLYQKYKNNDKKKAKEHLKKYVIVTFILNLVLYSIVFVLSLFMNPPLFIRTLPFFCIQCGVLLLLVQGYIDSPMG